MIETKEMQRNKEAVGTGEARQNNEQKAREQSDQSRGSEILFEQNEAEKFRTRWLEIQRRFVDDPGASVTEADELIGNLIKRITVTFSDKRISLESQWKNGEKVSTEDLRLVLRRYRSFFNRLLSLES